MEQATMNKPEEHLAIEASEQTSDTSEVKPSLSPLVIPSFDSKEADADATPAVVPATPTILVPSLRGKLINDGIMHVCRGVWALSDDAHQYPEQTSDFEFKLIKPLDPNDTSFPRSGKYQGYFHLKQILPLKTIKVDEKDMVIKFSKLEGEDGFSIEGEGSNKFGKFTLRGTVSNDGMLQMYRVYSAKPVVLKKAATTPGSKKIASETPRDGASRVRKRSSFGEDGTPIAASIASSPFPVPAITPRGEGRTPRLSQPIVRCGELLKEIMKLSQSVWFLEPVDYVKLAIPDYPLLITEPMDLGTIRQNLDRGLYTSPETFAEHVRLVFRNAITYNQVREHPVHVAARDLSNRFEERFRIISASFQNSSFEDFRGTSNLSSSSSVKKPNKSLKAAAATVAPVAASTPGGNRNRVSTGGSRGGDVYVPPPLDSSAHHLAEMQRKMQEMQNEIVKLRTAVHSTETQRSDPLMAVALTLAEKKTLINDILKLPPAKTMQVVEIIQSVLPADRNKDDSDEIEIPIDELDTVTLRRLQKFVSEASEKKKRLSNSGRSDSSAKRVKKESKSVIESNPTNRPMASNSSSYGYPAPVPQPQDLYQQRAIGDDEVEAADLLFSAESFDELRAGAGNGSDDESDSGDGGYSNQVMM